MLKKRPALAFRQAHPASCLIAGRPRRRYPNLFRMEEILRYLVVRFRPNPPQAGIPCSILMDSS